MARKTTTLSLTEFADVVGRSGTAKATALKNIKANDEYSPAADFYKQFRAHVVEGHKTGADRSHLKGLLSGLRDPKKIANYPGMLNGYSKWWGKRVLTWFSPPKGVVSRHGVDVRVGPELGLVIEGTRHVIKLYTRGEALGRGSAEVILRLMETNLSLRAGDKVAALDVKRSKLFVGAGRTPNVILDGLVDAELSYISRLWPTI